MGEAFAGRDQLQRQGSERQKLERAVLGVGLVEPVEARLGSDLHLVGQERPAHRVAAPGDVDPALVEAFGDVGVPAGPAEQRSRILGPEDGAEQHADAARPILRRVDGFKEEHSLDEVEVSIELIDGSLHRLQTLSSEPGYGFVSFRPHGEDDPAEVIVPLGAVREFRISVPSSEQAFGFAGPAPSD